MKHFRLEEFDSPDQPGSGKHMVKNFLITLDKAREIAGIAFKINSGFRSRLRNTLVGGSEKSSHLAGCAADIHCNNSLDRLIIIDACIKAGFNRIGIANTFIHVDNDITKNKAIWLY